MSANPLVVAPVDTRSPLAGTFLLEDGESFVRAVENQDWISGGMALFAGAMDTIAAVSDPLGTLFAMGLGWVMEHISPLKDWLDDLTGSSAEVAAFAGTWRNVAGVMHDAATTLPRMVGADLAEMSGEAVDAYRSFQADVAKHLGGAGTWADAMATGLGVCATLVQIVHDVVRDAIAEVVGAICSYAVELVCTAGLATPLVIEQATTRASALAGRVSSFITRLLDSCKHLKGLIDKLADLLRRFKSIFDQLLPGGGRVDGNVPGRRPSVDGDHVPTRRPSVDGEVPGNVPGRRPDASPDAPGAPDASPGAPHPAPDVPAARHPLPDISDIPHPKGTDAWAEAVAARHPTLTPDEVKAIHAYTSSPKDGFATNYDEMNTFLRDPQSIPVADRARIQEAVDLATSGMSKIDPTAGRTTYAGVDLPASILDRYQVGASVADPGFRSSSLNPDVAEAFRMRSAPEGGNTLFTIKGSSGVDVLPLSQYPREGEILFRPGVDMRVVDRNWDSVANCWRILLEEVVP